MQRVDVKKKYEELQATLIKSLSGFKQAEDADKYKDLVKAQTNRITTHTNESTYRKVNRELAFIDTVIHIAIIKEKLVELIDKLPKKQQEELQARIAKEEENQTLASAKPKKTNQLYYSQRQAKIDEVLNSLKLIQQELTSVAATYILTDGLDGFMKKQERTSTIAARAEELGKETVVFGGKEKKEKPGCFAGFMMCLFPCLRKEPEEERKPLMEDAPTTSYSSLQ